MSGTDHERSYLASRYPSLKFRKKLKKMGDAQVLAMYHKVKLRDEEAKHQKPKEEPDVPF